MGTIQIDQVKPQKAISVLLVEDVVNNNGELKQALLDGDYAISALINSSSKIYEKCLQHHPDILIIITQSPTANTLKELALIDQLAPLPVLIFAMQDSPALIAKSMKVGVSIYLVNEIPLHRLNSLITVAGERFKERQALRSELEQTKAQLANRKLIERAKGFIMQQKKISEDEAFNMLRQMAMNNGHSLATVAKNVIEVYQLLNPSTA